MRFRGLFMISIIFQRVFSRRGKVNNCFGVTCESSSSSSECFPDERFDRDLTPEVRKNVIVICDSSEDERDETGLCCDPREIARSILAAENLALQELQEEMKKEFLSLRAGIKVILDATRSDAAAGCLDCLDDLEKKTINSTIDSFNDLVPVTKEIVGSESALYTKNFLSVVSSVRTEVFNYIVYLQGIPTAALLQALILDTIYGPNPTLLYMVDSIVTNTTPYLSDMNISISNRIAKALSEEKELLSLKLRRYFTDTISCVQSTLDSSFGKLNASLNSALSAQVNRSLTKISSLIGAAEHQILGILSKCFPQVKNLMSSPAGCYSRNSCGTGNNFYGGESFTNPCTTFSKSHTA